MHEAPYAQGIMEILRKEAEANNLIKIERVKLRIGEMTGVVEDVLLFYLESMVKGTIAEGAVFEIEKIPTIVRCSGCRKEYHSQDIAPICPHCNSLGGEILSGKECEVVSIEAQREEAASGDKG
jgi:hydrogenase nickel incorporation protein HypA/HybF